MEDLTAMLANFWSQPEYEPYRKAPLTTEALAAFEERYRMRLPRTMVDLLRRQNGGYTNWTFPLEESAPDVVHRMVVGIGPGFPALAQEAWWQDPDGEDVWQPEEPMRLLSFDGDGHWDLCLDYRRSPVDDAGFSVDPCVTVVDCELESEEVVAASFDAYLARLARDDEDDEDDEADEA